MARSRVVFVLALALVLLLGAGREEKPAAPAIDLDPATWQEDYDRFLEAQSSKRSQAGYAEGSGGAVTVAYNGLAARAGLEALRQGGNAADAALTSAMAQVALTAGSPVSYFGIMSLVYYDAETNRVYTMNAEWNTVRAETEPGTIPGGINFSSEEALGGLGPPSGRTALVGGFMKGVEAAHERFGRLPFAELFKPSIYIAERGFPVHETLAVQFEFRAVDLARLPETRATFLKPDGSTYQVGEVFRQPALADTLRKVAEHGADYMYGGPWGKKLIALLSADGGRMTLEELSEYEVIWDEPLVGEIGEYTVYTNPYPNLGGVGLIEAQNLARAAGLSERPHWTESGDSLRDAVLISQMMFLNYLPPEMVRAIYPGLDMAPAARATRKHAEKLWELMQEKTPFQFAPPEKPRHSDDVVAIDAAGNIAAITHSINTVYWGKTAIVVDGVSIADAASFQQAQIEEVDPGSRLPSPTETGILFEDGKPVLGFASMGSGLHQRTFQALLNITVHGMDVREAIDTPDFFMPSTDPGTFALTVVVPQGKFERHVLDAMGLGYREIDPSEARLAGEGLWVGISRDPVTGRLKAASHNRNNSAAVAF